MNSKKKIDTTENPMPKKPKPASDMGEVLNTQDIYSLLLKMAQDLGKVAQDVGDVKSAMEDISLKVSQLDWRLSALESGSTSISTEIAGSFRAYNSLKEDLQKGRDKHLELDLKIRSKNLRLVGLEEENTEDLLQVIMDILKTSFSWDQIVYGDIDNVYRVGRKNGPKARQILISFVCTRIKEEILKNARKKGNGPHYTDGGGPRCY